MANITESATSLSTLGKSAEAMTVAEASKLMGVSAQFVRIGLQKGVLPFGYAVQISTDRYTYFISRQKFFEHTGIQTKGNENETVVQEET